ncbi:MAG: DMT family transporter [Chloroflexota bacterium]
MPDRIGLIYAFTYTVFWAAANVVMRRLTRQLSPTLIVGLRAVIGTLVLVPTALLVRPQDYALMTPTRVAFLSGSVVIGGVFGSIANVYSLKLLGVARSTPVSNSTPLFAILFSYLLLAQAPGPCLIPGSLLVLVGVYFVSRPGGAAAEQGRALSRRDLVVGLLFAVSAAALWGLNGVVLSMGLTGINPIVANSVRTPVVAVMSMAMSAVGREWPQMRRIGRNELWLLLLLGTVGYAVLSTLYVSAVQAIGPSLTQVIGNTAPLFALPLGMAFLGERPTRRTALGAALTVAGILLVV